MQSGQRSSADLARACGVKSPSVSQWLSGETKSLKAATAHRAAEYLGVNFLWLTEGRGPMRPSGLPAIPPPAEPPTVQELLSRLKTGTDTLPPTVRKAAADMITGYLISSDGDADATLHAIGTLLKLPKP